MTSLWLEPDLFAVVVFGLAAPLIGLVALLTRTSPGYGRWAAGAAFGAAALSAAAAWAGLARGYWLPLGVLALLCGGLLALQSRRLGRIRAGLLALLRCRPAQAAALVVVGPGLAGAWIWWNAPTIIPWQAPRALQLTQEKVRLEADPSRTARTDSGRSLAIYRPAEPRPTNVQLMEADTTVIAGRATTQGLIRTAPPSFDYNCHGWVFAGGRGWIEGSEVNEILQDNGYYEVNNPRPGDLAVYRDAQGEVSHSGVVRAGLVGGLLLIESKWGEGGRFLHAPDATPYGMPVYYRSRRFGHRLHGLGREAPAATTAVQ